MSKIIKAIPCPNCKQLYTENKKFCPNCGYKPQVKYKKYLIYDSILISSIFYANILFFIISIVWSFFDKKIGYDFFGFFSPHYIILEKLGMLYPTAIANGEFYRLINYAFLHGGLLHLLLNMFWFYYLAKEVKKFFSDSQFFLIYIFSSISGGIFALLFGGNAPVVGSSGAIFGLFGAVLAYGRLRKDFVGFILWKKYSFLVLTMIIFGFLIPGVSNSGHIGGLVGGFFLTWLMFQIPNAKIFFLIIYLLFFILIIWGFLHGIQFF